MCDSLSRTEVVYSVLGGKTNAWHLREIVRRRCEQRQKISTSADEQQDHAAQRGRDAFGSTPDQDPKAAKFAVLTPGPGMFVNVRNAPRVVIAPPSETPLFRRVCHLSPKAECVYPLSPVKANVGRLCEKLKNAMKDGLR